MTVSYNLVDQPWIPVQMADGTLAQLSIRQVFKDADQIRDIATSLPITELPVYWLLIAIAGCALRFGNPQQWGDAWSNGWKIRVIDQYLDDWHHRFDLFDAQQPFMQVAGLVIASADPRKSTGPRMSIDLMRAKGNNKMVRVWQPDSDIKPMPADQAALWLLASQAFALGGRITTDQRDLRYKGQSMISLPAGMHGPKPYGGAHYFPKGQSLRDTIMLNLPGDSDSIGQPVWERPPIDITADNKIMRRVTGWADWLTWTSRWALLEPNAAGQVARSFFIPGDRPMPDDPIQFDMHCIWIPRGKPEANKSEYVVDLRGLDLPPWRQIDALRGRRTTYHGGAAMDTPPPRVFRHLSGLPVPPDYPTRVAVYGVKYGNQAAVIDSLVYDCVDVQMATVLHADPNCPTTDSAQRALAVWSSVAAVNDIMDVTGQLGRDVYKAVHGRLPSKEQPSASAPVQAVLTSLVHHQYEVWLQRVYATPIADLDAVLQELGEHLRAAAREVLNFVLASVPTASYCVQATFDDNSGKRSKASAKAESTDSKRPTVPAAAQAYQRRVKQILIQQRLVDITKLAA